MKKVSVAVTKKKKVDDLFKGKRGYTGLCSCCNSFQTCTFLRDPGGPILQCEEFDGIIPSPMKKVSLGNVIPLKVQGLSATDKDNLGHYRGLCSLCENLRTCTYPKPEGGVWHCEEYR
jgi:hypothetical protein